MNLHPPPKRLLQFFRWFCHPDFVEDIEGDLHEKYDRHLRKHTKRKAWWLFLRDVLSLFRIGLMRPITFNQNLIHPVMFRHNLKISWRLLFKQKAYSLINIGGLALCMAFSLLICQYIYFELSYDKFHDNYQNTYRILFDKTKNGEAQGATPYQGYVFGESVKNEISEIKKCVRLYPAEYGAAITNADLIKPFEVDASEMFFVDKDFLDVFNFPLQQGSKETALNELYNIVITQKTAKIHFGSDDPMGKTLKITGGSSPGSYTVTGVFEKLPANSHLQFEYLMSLDNFWKYGNGGPVNRYDGWARNWFVNYFVINASANPDQLKKKLDQLIAKYKVKWNEPEGIVEKIEFQAIADIHLKSETYAEVDFVKNKGSLQDIRIFSMIALFLLIIAWVNYINLSTARSINRAKEIGIRKSIGAYKKQLISQFLVESTLVNLIAGGLAITIAFLMLPSLNYIIGKELELTLLQMPKIWVLLLVLLFCGSLISGLYPAFVLSAFKPISMLGNSSVNTRGINLRRGLITFQFMTSLLLISGTYLVYKQIKFMKHQELGMDIEQILILKGPKEIPDAPKVTDGTNRDQIRAYQAFAGNIFETFRQELASHHSIDAVTGSGEMPSQINNISRNDIRKFGEPSSAGKYGRSLIGGLDFLKTYDLELIAGSTFTEDMLNSKFVIINEEAIHSFGLGSPEEAIGEKLVIGSPRTIVGVVKNFHWESLKNKHVPYVIRFAGDISRYISIKMKLSNISETLTHIESTYNSVYPSNSFEYFFLEDEFNQQYQTDVQFGNLFFMFSLLAIFIACIGLFALVSFSATLRVKEIGIRKVLGASTKHLMMLLSREYFLLLLIAGIFSIPIVIYFGQSWLEHYAFRIGLEVDIFIIPILTLVLISFLTVCSQTYAAAGANPVKTLK